MTSIEMRLVEVLTQSDIAKRTAAYVALGLAVAQRKGGESRDARIYIKDVLYTVNELTVIDKESLQRQLTNASNYDAELRKGVEFGMGLGALQSFQGISGVDKHFDKNTVDSINADLVFFKQAVSASVRYVNDSDLFE